MSLNLLVLVTDNVDKCRAILEAWERAGVPGVTLIDTVGSQRILNRDDLPLMVSLRTMLAGNEAPNRTLFSLIEDEAVLELAIRAAQEIVGDFVAPHAGIMFVVPVSRAWGVLKVHPHE